MRLKKSLLVVLAVFGLLIVSCKQNADIYSGDKTQKKSSYTIEWTSTTEAENLVVKNVINYTSIDTAGKPITLSGYFEYSADTDVNQIILMEHGTISLNAQAPSVAKSAQSVPASKEKGRVVIAPDYLGFGASVDKVHPYVNEKLTAINSIDCELAVLQYFKDKNIEIADSHYTVVAGYSQGGSSALATHKYMEENLSASKQKLINLRQSFCGGTPADLVKTMDVYFAAESTNVGLVFYVIQGMMVSYPDVLAGYTLQDFYTDKVDAEKVAEAFNAKTDALKMMGATKLFPSDTSAENIHSAVMHDPESDLYKKFISCLKKQDLTDWEPKHHINFYHSTTDDTVPIENYNELMSENKMGRYPEMVEGVTGTGSHGEYAGTGFYPPFLAAINSME